MTQLLQKAFTEAAKLPEDEQDAFAAFLLEELDSERRWDDSFARSQGELAQLADEALAEHHAGKQSKISRNVSIRTPGLLNGPGALDS